MTAGKARRLWQHERYQVPLRVSFVI